MKALRNFLFLSLAVWTLVASADDYLPYFSTNNLPFFSSNYERDFFNLRKGLYIAGFNSVIPDQYKNPLIGKTDFMLSSKDTPWAGNFFPMQDGGLANRWQVSRGKDKPPVKGKHFVNPKKLPKKSEIRAMSADQINLLSPIEKYDLYRNDYKFTGTLFELYDRGPLRDYEVEDWEGFCNGVRCAAINLPEPKQAIQVVNKDGLKITFQPADLKALAGASYFYVEKYAQMGAPTLNEGNLGEDQPNAAIFDMTLRYLVGEAHKSFIIDSHLGNETWNENVVGFSREVLAPVTTLTSWEISQYPGVISKVKVRVELKTLAEIDIPKSNQATKDQVAAGQMHKTIPLEYVLYLDANNNAVGGAWKKLPGKRGVDFAWFGNGKGVDSKSDSGNSDLSYTIIRRLVKMSSEAPVQVTAPTAMSCRSVLGL